MNVFFLREKMMEPTVAPLAVSWWWLLSKQSTGARLVTILRTPRKAPVGRPHPKGKGGYWCQDCNSRAETDKAAIPHKSIKDQPLILEPVSNAHILPTLCSLQEKKIRSNPNFYPICSDQRPDMQTKQKIGHSLSIPTTGFRHKVWDYLMSTSQEPKLLDKQTPEHQECNSHHHPLPLLPPLNEVWRRHRHP